MVLSPEQVAALSASEEEAGGIPLSTVAGAALHRHTRAVVTVTSKKWPGGVLPYTISDALSEFEHSL